MCLLTSSIPPSCGKSVPGMRKIWLARKANAMIFTHVNDNFSIVDMILNAQGTPTPFYEYECDVAYDNAPETFERNTNGRSFPVSLDLRFARMQAEKRSTLEALIYDTTIGVYVDRNGRYWVVGQDNGLRVSEYTGTPDNSGGGNGYVLKLIGREKYLRREVNGTKFIYTSPNGGPGGNGGAGPVKTGLGGSGPGGGITAELATWQSAATGKPMPLSQLGRVPLKEFFT